jgi:hypothetical protein
MAYLNIVIGLGGTGLEIVNDILTITNRHGLTKGNKLEWFVVDTDSLTELKAKENPFVYNDYKKRFVKVREWDSAKEVVERLKNKNPDSNFQEIFPDGDYIHEVNSSNTRGAWVIRKIGYLSLLYDLLYNDQNIINQIDKCLNRDNNLGDFDEINLHIVSSMAGGTGSGMFTALGFILYKYLKDNYSNQKLHISSYGYLATPSLVARGSRSADPDKPRFEANAYQVLLELNTLLNSRKKSWRIKLNERFNFELNPNDNNFFKTVFVIDMQNIMNVNWGGEDYKPSFQMIAWSIYFWLNGTSDFYAKIGNPLNNPSGGWTSGIGVQVYEFPYHRILHKLAENYFFRNFFRYYKHFEKESEINSQETAKEKLKNYYNRLLKKENFGSQQKKYRNELTQYNNSASINMLRSTKPAININDYQTDFDEFFSHFINGRLNDYLHNYDLEYVIKYISHLLQFTEEEIDSIQKVLSNKNDRIKQLERYFETEKKYKNIFKTKSDTYFSLIYQYESGLMYSKYLQDVKISLEKIMTIFKDCRSILTDIAPTLDSEIAREKYFAFPPPRLIFKSEYEKLDDLVNELYREILNSYKDNDSATQDTENLEYNLYYDIWKNFSDEKLNNILLNLFNDVIINRKKEWNNDLHEVTKKQVYEDLFKYIKTFIDGVSNLKYIIAERNNLEDIVNRDHPPEINYSYPFINMNNEVINNIGDSYILAGENTTMRNIEDASIFNVLSTDDIVMFARIRAQLRWDDLSLERLENSFRDRRSRNEEVWNQSVDAQIDEIAKAKKDDVADNS